MTERQKEIIEHALGLTKRPWPYRRHFSTGPGSKDWNDCRALCDQGLMEDNGRRGGIHDGNHLFLVTRDGAKAVHVELPVDIINT